MCLVGSALVTQLVLNEDESHLKLNGNQNSFGREILNLSPLLSNFG